MSINMLLTEKQSFRFFATKKASPLSETRLYILLLLILLQQSIDRDCYIIQPANGWSACVLNITMVQ